MASLFNRVTGNANKQGAPAKGSKNGNELKKLRRQDLLELLVGQMREADALRATIAERDITITELNALVDRLKDKLDLKDEQLENLKSRLDGKDVQIDRLKDRLNDKDAQMARLYPKLDDKDVTIERLKKRLDSKDLRIEQLEERVRIISHEKGMLSLEELLHMEEQAMERFARHGMISAAKEQPEAANNPEQPEEQDESGEPQEPEADSAEAEEVDE